MPAGLRAMVRRHRHNVWSPLSLGASLIGWWGTRFELSYADNDVVGSATDQSKMGHTATASGTTRSVFKVGITDNNHPVFRFDGSNDTLTAAGAVIAAQPMTFLCVAKITTKKDFGCLMGGIAGTNTAFLTNGLGKIGLYDGVSLNFTGGDVSGAFHVFEGVLNGASSLAGTDGVLGALTMNATSALANGIALGNNAGSFFNGDIAEAILVSGALAAVVRSSARRYFGSVYGISVTE